MKTAEFTDSSCLALLRSVPSLTVEAAAEQLVASTLGRGNRTKYSYDANGLRINRTDSTGVINYLLTGPSVLEELDSLGHPVTQLLNHPQAIDDVVSFDKGGATYFPLTDALGSVYATVDSAGTIAHRYDYDVWGLRSDLGGSGPSVDFGYTGRWHDKSGLIEHRDRARNPNTGNWLQPDHRTSLSSPNRYLFADERPTTERDSKGDALDSARANFLMALMRGDLEQAAYYYELATGAENGALFISRLINLLGTAQKAVKIVGTCVTVARGTFGLFQQFGFKPQLLEIRLDKYNVIGFETIKGDPKSTVQVSQNAFHTAVLVDGKVYDKATGYAGMNRSEYESRLVPEDGAELVIDVKDKLDDIPELANP